MLSLNLCNNSDQTGFCHSLTVARSLGRCWKSPLRPCECWWMENHFWSLESSLNESSFMWQISWSQVGNGSVTCEIRKKSQMSHLMRLWHCSSSVNSFFKHACAAIQWGYISDFWSNPSSTSILYVRTVMALVKLYGCAGSPEPSLVACVISTIISCAGSNIFSFSLMIYLPMVQ